MTQISSGPATIWNKSSKSEKSAQWPGRIGGAGSFFAHWFLGSAIARSYRPHFDRVQIQRHLQANEAESSDMPKPYQPHIQSDAAAKLARRALEIKWFACVGSASEEAPGIRWVHDWRTAIASLRAPAWDHYLNDASNAMADPVPRPQFNDWNWVIDEVNRVILPSVPEAINASLPMTGPAAEDVTKAIISIVRLSCVEAHFAQWMKVPLFQEMFHWFERGRLPCGAVGGFPARPILVF